MNMESAKQFALSLLRIVAGVIFFCHGAQKFLGWFGGFMGQPGATAPHLSLMGLAAVIEFFGGALIILGLFTRLAAVPLTIIMVVALMSTKLPILLGHDVGMFHLSAEMKRTGFWSAMHESRADLTMLLGCIYLLIVGAGKWSLDARLAR